MKRKRKLLLAFALVVPVTLISCGNPATVTTPAPPNSAQVQLHNINKTFADSINASVHIAITLRDQGKLSPAITKQIEDWSVPSSIVSDKIETEIASADTWTVQKQKIVVLLTGFQLPNTGPVDATIQAALSAVQTLLVQLRAQVNQ